MVEAMSFGIPVIAPPVGGPVEILGDGLSAYLIDSRELSRIATKIGELIDDEQEYKRVSLKARNRALLFSPEVFQHNVEKLFRERITPRS